MNSANTSFTGSYAYTLDAKGRANIPAKMRKALHESNDRTFVVTRGSDKCLVLYPVDTWRKIEEKLLTLNTIKAVNRHFIRNFTQHAEPVQYDGQGRVAIPNRLIEYANIEKDVEIVGMIDRIELWNPEKLRALESEFEERDDELEAIASEIAL